MTVVLEKVDKLKLCSHYDRLAMNNCKLVSFQDTWWTRFQKVNGTYGICRAYVQNSWIEGSTDYIWGSGDVLIENSTFITRAMVVLLRLHVVTKPMLMGM